MNKEKLALVIGCVLVPNVAALTAIVYLCARGEAVSDIVALVNTVISQATAVVTILLHATTQDMSQHEFNERSVT